VFRVRAAFSMLELNDAVLAIRSTLRVPTVAIYTSC
jgi:hypothetical protein